MHLAVLDEGSKAPTDFLGLVEEKTARENSSASNQSASATDTIAHAKLQGYTGSICGGCGSMKMKRNGSCEVCLDCGATSGCS